VSHARIVEQSSIDVEQSPLDDEQLCFDDEQFALDVEQFGLDVEQTALDVEQSASDVEQSCPFCQKFHSNVEHHPNNPIFKKSGKPNEKGKLKKVIETEYTLKYNNSETFHYQPNTQIIT